MSTTFKEAIEWNGKWVRDAMDIMRDHRPKEVLPCLFELDEIEYYVTEKKKEISKMLLQALNQTHLEWIETGEGFIIDDDFVEYYLEINCTLKQLRTKLSSNKMDSTTLMKLLKTLVEEPNFKSSITNN